MTDRRSSVTVATSTPPAIRSGRFALPALLLGAAAIGFAPILVRVSELGPSATAFYRLLFALPALWAWRALASRAPGAQACAGPPARQGFIAAGLFFAADLAVWHWSLRFTSVANATLFPNFAPVLVTLAGFVLFDERFSRLFLLGMGLAIAGALILMGWSFELGAGHVLGDTLALATALFYAGYIIVVGRLRAQHDTASIMAWSGLVACAVLLPVAVLSGESLWPATTEGWASDQPCAGAECHRLRPGPPPRSLLCGGASHAAGRGGGAGLGAVRRGSRSAADRGRRRHPRRHRGGPARQRQRQRQIATQALRSPGP